ncbi:MAG: hypothetical protein ACOH1O_11605 [Flavobacterium sp.]
MEKIKFYPQEEFRQFEMPPHTKLNYAISNRGRLISYKNEMAYGRILNGALADGYRAFNFKLYNQEKKNRQYFYYRLVAENFLKKDSEEQIYVLHLDYNRANDDLSNLKWATKEEMLAHAKKSPYVIQAKANLIEHNRKLDGRKLTITKVMLIKKMLANPDRTTRLKMIAKQFGVSEMQIRRIASGENWGYI